MAWDWIEKSTKRLQELGGEYKQHHALLERLLALDAAAAQEEMTRAWQAMDDRARAGLKMTLAGLTLSQQAATSSAEAKLRLERLKALHTLVDRPDQDAPSVPRPASTEAAVHRRRGPSHQQAGRCGRARQAKSGAADRVGPQRHRAAWTRSGVGGQVGDLRAAESRRAAEGRRAAEERRLRRRAGGVVHSPSDGASSASGLGRSATLPAKARSPAI